MITALVVIAILALLVALVLLLVIGSVLANGRDVPASPACRDCPENCANYPERAA